MSNTVTQNFSDRNHRRIAVECGTLSVFLGHVLEQPVMIMPLSRTIPQGTLKISQWVLHLTTWRGPGTPIYYATFRAAEVVHTLTGQLLSYPYQASGRESVHLAERLQHQLLSCLCQFLEPRVPSVVAPARFRLPDDAWIWSASCQEPLILCQQKQWIISVPEVPHA